MGNTIPDTTCKSRPEEVTLYNYQPTGRYVSRIVSAESTTPVACQNGLKEAAAELGCNSLYISKIHMRKGWTGCYGYAFNR